jgi:hypothetical protein
MSDTLKKTEVIEAQADQILTLLKEVEDIENDYKKLADEHRLSLKVMDSKDLTIAGLRKKNNWSMPEIMLAIVVSGVFLGIGIYIGLTMDPLFYIRFTG